MQCTQSLVRIYLFTELQDDLGWKERWTPLIPLPAMDIFH